MRLLENRVYILDGGVSTHLETYCKHFPIRQLWSSSLLLEHQNIVRKAHQDWHCDLLSTVTYQCHYEQQYWPPNISSDIMDKMIADGVEIARSVAGNRQVVASSGCYGAILSNGAEYTGDYGEIDIDRLIQFHKKKLEKYQELQVPTAIETVPSALECRAIASLTDKYDVAWISLSCKDESHLNDGTPVEEALEILKDVECGVGFNCCHAKHLPSLVARLLRHDSQKSRPIVLYPNSGEIWDAANESWAANTKDDNLVEKLGECVDLIEKAYAGNGRPAIVLGGCCRTSPKEIKELYDRYHR